MAWTEVARERYRRDGLHGASDMTDAEWAHVAPLMPRPQRLGRPRRASLRRVVEAILFIVSSGTPCRWSSHPVGSSSPISGFKPDGSPGQMPEDTPFEPDSQEEGSFGSSRLSSSPKRPAPPSRRLRSWRRRSRPVCGCRR
ncbi:MAG: transposase [Burkholderiales bacterium]|nr:MAG: transposase [Burkholderiales bacterium]